MADLNYIIENIDEAVFRHYGDKNNAGRMLGITNSTRKRNHMDVIFENKILEFSVNEDELELVGIRHIFDMNKQKTFNDECFFGWCHSDIRMMVPDEVQLSDAQIKEIGEQIAGNTNANYGLNWEIISDEIQKYIDENNI